MDISSFARHLSRPFLITEDLVEAAHLPIGARALIGDGHTAALVRVDGAIDWLCMPRFDSPSVFGQLLDAEQGGLTALTPARRPFESVQRYDPETNVLETLFTVPEQGTVRLVDHMPWLDDHRASIHEVHRRIECIDGEVELLAVFDPRFDYGRGSAEISSSPHGVLAKGEGGERFAFSLEVEGGFAPRAEGGVERRFTVRRGQRVWAVLSWNAAQVEPARRYRPYELLRSSRRQWRAWSQGLGYDGPWRHHVMRSALVLKLLQYAPTGAVVAAPTTSLPEWIGGLRNWDYRYSWARDAALSIKSHALIGYVREAREFFHFLRDTLDRSPTFHLMNTLDGDRVPDEVVLEHLAGYRGSQPVRIGNGAHDQLQNDSGGYVLDAAWTFERLGGSLTLRVWRHLMAIVDHLHARWRAPDHGIWEPRGVVRHNVHSKVMAWVGFDRALRIAPLFGGSAKSPLWRDEAEAVRREVLECGLSPDGRRLVSYYGGDEADATLLLLPLYGFLSASDPRVEATVTRVREALGENGYLHRYRYDDGVGGREGAFILCGFWLAEVLAMMGRVEEAQEVFIRHAEITNHVGLLAEEVDPRSGQLLGNFPQAFSHLGLINAAARIDLALRLRDEGSTKRPYFGLDA